MSRFILLVLFSLVFSACAPADPDFAASPTIIEPTVARPAQAGAQATFADPTGSPSPSKETPKEITPPVLVTAEIGSMQITPVVTASDPMTSTLAQEARADLAKRLSMPTEMISLVKIETVTWPDSSLGCPQPGMVYAPALEDGALIQLKVGEKVYEYHSGGSKRPFLCENNGLNQALPQNPTETLAGDSVMTPEPATLYSSLVDQAVADLVKRLKISTDEVKVVSVEMVTWPDASLGCPQPGMAYAQVLQDGLRIRLEANGQTYQYHSGGSRAPFLCENAP